MIKEKVFQIEDFTLYCLFFFLKAGDFFFSIAGENYNIIRFSTRGKN